MANEISIKCTQCSSLNLRKYGWIDPAKFTKPTAAFLVSTFHCKKCEVGNTVKIQYLPENKFTLIESLDFKAQIRYDPMPFYIGGPSGDDDKTPEVLSEGDALTLLQDVED